MSDDASQTQDHSPDNTSSEPAQGEAPENSPESKPLAHQTKHWRMLDRIFSSDRPESKARKETDAQQRKAQREADKKAREEQRKASRDRARQYKDDKESQKVEEKKTQDSYNGGVFWGFDPNAGMVRSENDGGHATRLAGGANRYANHLRPSDIPKPVRGQTWGVQHGEPHGALASGGDSGS